MGFFDFIGSCFSSVCSYIGGAISEAVSCCIGIGESACECLTGMVQDLFKAVGVLRSDETVEEVGDRIIQAAEAGISSNDFDNFDEYKKQLDEFELDPKKSEMLSKHEKQAMGLAVLSKGLDEKTGISSYDFYALWSVNSDFFNLQRGQAWMKLACERQFDCSLINQLLDGKLDPKLKPQVVEFIDTAEKRYDPDSSYQKAMNAMVAPEKNSWPSGNQSKQA